MVTITKTYEVNGRSTTLTVTAPSSHEALEAMGELDPMIARINYAGGPVELGTLHCNGNLQPIPKDVQ